MYKKIIVAVSLSIMSVVTSCGDKGTGPDIDSPVIGNEYAYVVTTDYGTSGYLSSIETPEITCTQNITTLYSDVSVNSYGGYLYVIEKLNSDKIIKLDPAAPLTPVAELSVAMSSNPHSIEFASATKAYVTRYGTTNLWIINPTSMVKVGKIDLSAFVAYAGSDSAESVPHMASMSIVDKKLYVVCQRLKGWDIGDVAQVVVINTLTDSVESSIDLTAKNPQAMYQYNNKLYIACTGAWGVNDGGVEVINTQTGVSEGILVAEPVGKDITNVIVVSNSKGYVITSALPNNNVTAFNLADGVLGATLPEVTSAGGFALNTNNELYVLERATAADGIYVYNPLTGQLKRGLIDCGLPPAAITFITVQ